jgi:sec-independent protein translocase protein TatA
VILLLVFGPKRLPGLGRQLGGGMREFKDSITGKMSDDDDGEQATPSPQAALPGATTPPAAAPVAPASEPVAGERDPAAPGRA